MQCRLIAQHNGGRKNGPKQAATPHFIHPSDAKAIAGIHQT
jgi:hypothetical protein